MTSRTSDPEAESLAREIVRKTLRLSADSILENQGYDMWFKEREFGNVCLVTICYPDNGTFTSDGVFVEVGDEEILSTNFKPNLEDPVEDSPIIINATVEQLRQVLETIKLHTVLEELADV